MGLYVGLFWAALWWKGNLKQEQRISFFLWSELLPRTLCNITLKTFCLHFTLQEQCSLGPFYCATLLTSPLQTHSYTYIRQQAEHTTLPSYINWVLDLPSTSCFLLLCPPGRPVDGGGAGVGALLLPAWGRDVPPVRRAAGHLRLGGRVTAYGCSQALAAGPILRCLLLHTGVQHQGVLHGRHAGRI